MSLHPELVPIVGFLSAVEEQPPSPQSVGELRNAYAGLCAAFGAGSADVDVVDHRIDGAGQARAARLYRPRTAGPGGPSGDTLSGAILWFHGGGWVIGDLDTHDALCRDLCAASGLAVLSVDYRRAPEHRFPAAADDALAAFDWLLEHGPGMGVDPASIVVGGDSAGGQLATVVARRLRDRGGAHRPAAQVLVYPVTDLRADADHPSRERNGSGYILTTQTMDFFTATYVPDPADRETPDASPIVADLTGLAPALVVVAEYDPLHDEGTAYATALRDAGVRTELEVVEGGVHLVAQMVQTQPGRQVIARIASFVAELRGEVER